ncbi:AraC family transcriptional regulator [Corallococcus sp. H22C18031201]|uniref:AraC family transcriptional regulator n=1 Tax=Citreicoccus inhibens TaxID=2849499 RepID=UPI000E75FCCC|nr:AraC family transcriptional regulator [Citreicoccus inhibens]MBU8894269.1 AraC family transcriptional regulator [Citreicoccus inhibens]RJS23041.1 AraC family transcriptional regulator [Corallococcus sp. H22C18031201]
MTLLKRCRPLLLALLASATTVASAEPPAPAPQKSKLPVGWYVTESAPQHYEASVETSSPCEGSRSAVLHSRTKNANGYGTFMQAFGAQDFRGKRLRFSANMRVSDVQGWAGLWMRVEGADPRLPLAFDNMQSRALMGTTRCKRFDVVLDVPQDATTIMAGLIMSGTGEAWLDGVRFDTVDASVPVTDLLASRPVLPPAPKGLEAEPVVSKNDMVALGRVGDIWFNHGRVNGHPTFIRQATGTWQSLMGEELFEHGIEVNGTLEQRDVKVKVTSGGPVTTIKGTWGPDDVFIEFSAQKLTMQWGIYTRELVRDLENASSPQCNRYHIVEGPRETDQLELCGATLGTRPPLTQLVAAFLGNGFRATPRFNALPVPMPPIDRRTNVQSTERSGLQRMAQ